MKTLDFMIVGAQKAGTTALSYFLDFHPEIAMAKGKEVHLFSEVGTNIDLETLKINEHYSHFFESVDQARLWGEATPLYFFWPPIVPMLERYNASLKLIVLLRDPVERAISHYHMEKVRTKEWLPLWLALLVEPFRLYFAGKALTHSIRCHSYIKRGLYAEQLIRLREHFPDNQILIIENAELRIKHNESLQKVFKFLGVQECNIPASRVFEGGGGISGSRFVRSIVKPFLRWRFRRSNQMLKKVLIEMNVPCDWPWLK